MFDRGQHNAIPSICGGRLSHHIKVPGTEEQHIVWTRRVTCPELARRQFMVYLKMMGVDELEKINTLLVQYLNRFLLNVCKGLHDD